MTKTLAVLLAATVALAASPSDAADAPAAAAPAAKPTYNTTETPLGTLLDDPAAKAVLEKHIPSIIKADSIDMARGMSLKAVQSYAGDALSDETLAAIDADLAKLPAK